MVYLILGLVLFLGVHSVRIVADGWRSRMLQTVGEKAWKGGYTVVSLLGFGLIVWGFGLARENPVYLWSPPFGLRHPSMLLSLLAFVLLAAAYVPGNQIKARLHHPMLLGVKSWALAHLLVNGNLAQVLLFGSFLAWGVAAFIACRKRDRAAGTVYPPGRLGRTLLTLAVGVAAGLLFAFSLHGLLIGVRPVG